MLRWQCSSFHDNNTPSPCSIRPLIQPPSQPSPHVHCKLKLQEQIVEKSTTTCPLASNYQCFESSYDCGIKRMCVQCKIFNVCYIHGLLVGLLVHTCGSQPLPSNHFHYLLFQFCSSYCKDLSFSLRPHSSTIHAQCNI
jgi:hypothetical protein